MSGDLELHAKGHARRRLRTFGSLFRLSIMTKFLRNYDDSLEFQGYFQNQLD